MFPHAGVGQLRLLADGELRRGYTHSCWHPGKRHEVLPLWTVRFHAIPVYKAHGGVGCVVAQHLIQELGRLLNEPRRKGNFGATGVVTPERATKSCAHSKRNLAMQSRHAPQPPPMNDLVSKLTYPDRVHRLFRPYGVWHGAIVLPPYKGAHQTSTYRSTQRASAVLRLRPQSPEALDLRVLNLDIQRAELIGQGLLRRFDRSAHIVH